MRVPIAVKRCATGRALDPVNSPAAKGLGMSVPPRHTALHGTEALFPRTRRVSERLAAVSTDTGYQSRLALRHDAIPPTEGLYGIFGHAKLTRDAPVPIALVPQSDDLFLL